MATPDNRNSETTEQWVHLEHDGDTGKDVLFHNQDGDERVGKENDLKVAEVLDGNQNTGLHSISSCFRSAWNDVVVRKALWEDQRPYVFLIALFVNAVYQKARREEYFAWYVQLPADVVRLQALTGAMVVSTAITFLMGPDIRALRRASLRLSQELWEARRRGDAPWWPKRGIPEGLAAMARGSLKEVIITLAMMAPLIIIFTLSPDGAKTGPAWITGYFQGRLNAALDRAPRSPRGRREAQVMSSSGSRKTETMQSEPDERWVCLQHDGDTFKEMLLKEQDGDEKEAKECTRNAAEVLEGAQDEGFISHSWCLRSAWNDALVHKALRKDRRPCVLGVTLSINVVLILLSVLESLTNCHDLQVTLTCLRHFTMAMLYAATASWATGFLSLSALKASVVKKFEVYPAARRQAHFVLPLQLLADVARAKALTGAVVLTVWSVYLMATDIRTTFCAVRQLCQELCEARKRGRITPPFRGMSVRKILASMARSVLKRIVVISCGMVLLLMIFMISPGGAFLGQVALAADIARELAGDRDI
ncbi:hypothetical protein MRX96_036167 [Rhipicephalus microplus]